MSLVFNVGDVVTIREDLIGEHHYGETFMNPAMTFWLGKKMTIYSVNECVTNRTAHVYCMKEDNRRWVWDEEMIKEFVEQSHTHIGIRIVNETETADLRDYIINPDDTTTWDSEEVQDLANDVKELFNTYYDRNDEHYPYNDATVKRFITDSNKAKGWIERFMLNHPNYNRDAHAICVDRAFERNIDSSKINDFFNLYLTPQVEKYIAENLSYEDLTHEKIQWYRNIGRELDKANEIINVLDYFSKSDRNKFSYEGRSYRYYIMKRDSLYEIYDEFRKWDYANSIWINGKAYKMNHDGEKFYRAYCTLRSIICDSKNERLDEREVRSLKDRASEWCDDFLKPVAGQKKSTILKKFAKQFGFDKHKDMQTINWTDPNTGEIKSKEKDMGWNKKFTEVCDALKPLSKKFKVYLSVNPVDFLTMSIGDTWSSCMTIDKTDIHDTDTQDYRGCYSAGTTDYALDEVTMIMYLLPADYEGNKPALEGKVKRCLFYMGEDKIIQSRVYPDGRDGSDFPSMSEDMRNTLIDIFNTCNEELAGWDITPSNNVRNVETYIDRNSCTKHYADYFHYSDAHTLIRNIKVKKSEKRIWVGQAPYCLCCGHENDREDAIMCSNCGDKGYEKCEYCGNEIDLDTYDYIEIDGHYYCDSECAYEAGWRDTVDAGWCHYEDCYQDDYTYEYYYYNEDGISTEDGHWYACAEHAEHDGYRETKNGEWHYRDYVRFCEACGEYVHVDDWNDELECCNDCADNIENDNSNEEAA